MSGAPLWSAIPASASTRFDMWKPSIGAIPASGTPALGSRSATSAATVDLPVPGGPVSPRTRTRPPLPTRSATSSTTRRAIRAEDSNEAGSCGEGKCGTPEESWGAGGVLAMGTASGFYDG